MSPADAAASDGPKLKKWAEFNWEDPMLFEDQLTEEEKLVRDSTYQYAHSAQDCTPSLSPLSLTQQITVS